MSDTIKNNKYRQSHRYRAIEVANYFIRRALEENIFLDPMKLQKLVYYAHGWSMALYNRELISDKIKAWPYGPVIEELYYCFKKYGKDSIDKEYSINDMRCEIPRIDENDIDTLEFLNDFWDSYKNYTGIQLSNATHIKDGPWNKTIKENISPIISNDIIKEYFKKLANTHD